MDTNYIGMDREMDRERDVERDRYDDERGFPFEFHREIHAFLFLKG